MINCSSPLTSLAATPPPPPSHRLNVCRLVFLVPYMTKPFEELLLHLLPRLTPWSLCPRRRWRLMVLASTGYSGFLEQSASCYCHQPECEGRLSFWFFSSCSYSTQLSSGGVSTGEPGPRRVFFSSCLADVPIPYHGCLVGKVLLKQRSGFLISSWVLLKNRISTISACWSK